jgi:hypothetical protein
MQTLNLIRKNSPSPKHTPWLVTFLAGMAATMLVNETGCSKKADVKAQVSALEKAFPAAAEQAGQPDQSAAPQDAKNDANAYVRAALSAVRSNDYAAGVVVLQNVAMTPGVTPNQLIAAEQAKQAMVANLVSRAAAGDPNAKAALQQIERTRSQ